MRTEILRDGAALAAIGPAWRALYERCPDASPFQSPDWLLPWWSVFAPGEPRVAAVSAADRLVALAPVYLEEASGRLLPIGISLSDDTDVLVDPDAPEAGDRLVAALSGEADWTSWSLEDLAEGAAGLRLPVPEGCAETAGPQSARPALPIGGARDGDGLPLAIPADRRRKIRRARRLLAAQGGGTVDWSPEPEAFLGALIRLHGARWSSRGEDGILSEAPVVGFHRAALPGLVAAGIARTALLRVEGKPVAAYYGLCRGERALAYVGGFDPAFAAISPGALLVAEAIRRAADDGAGTFDFLRGQEAYKYAWGATDRWTMRRAFGRTRP